MVFIMKSINYLPLLISLSFLYALLITINSSLTLQTQSWVYATSSEQEDKDNNQEETQASSENTNCPTITELSNLPLYIGQDGCQYPCPSFDSNNDQDNISQGCDIEPSASPQTNTEFSVEEENPSQTPSQEHQQVKQPQQQQQLQESQDNPNQNAFVSPSVNSDTGTAVSNSETPTTTTAQKSFTPAGKLRSGPIQTESKIPSLSNDPSKPFTPGGGNPQVEGIPNQPNTNPQTSFEPGKIDTNILTPSKRFDPADTFKTGRNLTSVETSKLSRCAADITGKWNGNDGGNYYLRQIGNEVWWFGSNIFKANGEFNTFSNVFSGIKKGLTVDGDWQDVPLGDTNSKGKISLILDPNGEKMTKKSATGGFGGTEWTKKCPNVFGKIKPNLPTTTDVVK